MSGKPTRQSKQLIIILKSFIQRSNQTAVGSREPSWWKRETGRWEEKKKIVTREITTEWGRLKAGALVAEPMKMQETGCGRSLLPGQQSPSPLFVSHGLGTDGTLFPHGRHYRDLQKTSGQDPEYSTQVWYGITLQRSELLCSGDKKSSDSVSVMVS